MIGTRITTTFLRAAALLSLATPLAAQSASGQMASGAMEHGKMAKGMSGPEDPGLAAARAALAKYKDPMQAVRDGYFSTVACIEFHGGAQGHMSYKPGAMGVHFLNPATIGPTLDPTKPQVLLYEPKGDKLVLTGAEWFVPVAVSKTPPTLFGQTLMGPMEGHQPIMPESLHHWDLHVWLFKDNPAGTFSPTNANVKCPAAGYAYSFDDAPPKIVKP